MLDVTIMLFVVMTGKQVVNNFVELGVPFIMGKLRARKSGYNDVSRHRRWELTP